MKGKRIWEAAVGILEIVGVIGLMALTCWLIWRYTKAGDGQMVTADVAGMTDEGAEEEDESPANSGSSKAEEDKKEESQEHTVQADERQADGMEPFLKRIGENPDIRVRILTTGYNSDCHDVIEVSCASSYKVREQTEVQEQKEDQTEQADGGEEAAFSQMEFQRDEHFQIEAGDLSPGQCLAIEAESEEPLCVCSIERSDGIPQYAGRLLVRREPDGLALINELPLEQYLYSVVSSEMPSYYPGEAQNAQAVCARTYAWNCILRREDSTQFDLDDSVSFQVYRNFADTESSRSAVEETKGLILPESEALYYSTSCLSEHRDDLGNSAAFGRFLQKEPKADEEYSSPWLRWQTEVSASDLILNLSNQGVSMAAVTEIGILLRSGNGQVQRLQITGNGESHILEGEYAIRTALAPHGAINLYDGTTAEISMLPSAFFVFGTQTDGNTSQEQIRVESTEPINISGGGYGHGTGMSQCGAAAMAERGEKFLDILQYYYGDD